MSGTSHSCFGGLLDPQNDFVNYACVQVPNHSRPLYHVTFTMLCAVCSPCACAQVCYRHFEILKKKSGGGGRWRWSTPLFRHFEKVEVWSGVEVRSPKWSCGVEVEVEY